VNPTYYGSLFSVYWQAVIVWLQATLKGIPIEEEMLGSHCCSNMTWECESVILTEKGRSIMPFP